MLGVFVPLRTLNKVSQQDIVKANMNLFSLNRKFKYLKLKVAVSTVGTKQIDKLLTTNR